MVDLKQDLPRWVGLAHQALAAAGDPAEPAPGLAPAANVAKSDWVYPRADLAFGYLGIAFLHACKAFAACDTIKARIAMADVLRVSAETLLAHLEEQPAPGLRPYWSDQDED